MTHQAVNGGTITYRTYRRVSGVKSYAGCREQTAEQTSNGRPGSQECKHRHRTIEAALACADRTWGGADEITALGMSRVRVT